jgi:molybdopterin synthase catalytic subunit
MSDDVAGAQTIPQPQSCSMSLTSENGLCVVSLTHEAIVSNSTLRSIRSPVAGANVLFLGTTRNSFDGRAVSRLSYSAYPALALRTLLEIAEHARSAHGLERVHVTHRLGVVEVEEESIAVAVSAAHRGPAWRGAEEILERCKHSVEIWKLEEFMGEESGEWRANKDCNSDGKSLVQR